MAKMNWEKASRDQMVREKGGTWHNEKGTKVANKKRKTSSTIMNSKFKGYCASCHYTIWQGEKIRYNGNAVHLDCKVSISDPTPRVIDQKWLSTLGNVNKKKLKEKINRSKTGSPKG